jgi:hypothetical protein
MRVNRLAAECDPVIVAPLRGAGMRGFLILLVSAVLLAGCSSHPRRGGTLRVAAPPETPGALRKCLADMAALGAKVQVLPDRTWPDGCSATSAVKLVAIGIPVTNLGAMKCGAALSLTQWVTQAVQSAARDRFGTYVTKIESFGSFACRPVNNVEGNKLSEHARANAVDIAGFILANGRRITVKADWNGPDPQARAFLRQLRDAGCRRFNIVLSPDYNAYHQDHLHFDMGNWKLCR